jgi:hypothetical protein
MAAIILTRFTDIDERERGVALQELLQRFRIDFIGHHWCTSTDMSRSLPALEP